MIFILCLPQISRAVLDKMISWLVSFICLGIKCLNKPISFWFLFNLPPIHYFPDSSIMLQVNHLVQLVTSDWFLLPLWKWAACVYQSLMHSCSFTMTRHVPSCFSEACSIPEPFLCWGFLECQVLPHQIFYFLHDYLPTHLSQALVFVIFQREFL